MMAMMTEKFKEKQLKVDVEIIEEESQARYFYSKLKTIRLGTT